MKTTLNLVDLAKNIVRKSRLKVIDNLLPDKLKQLQDLRRAYHAGDLDDGVGPPSLSSVYELVKNKIDFPYGLTVFKEWMKKHDQDACSSGQGTGQSVVSGIHGKARRQSRKTTRQRKA